MTPDVARFWWELGQAILAAEQEWIAREMERACRRQSHTVGRWGSRPTGA